MNSKIQIKKQMPSGRTKRHILACFTEESTKHLEDYYTYVYKCLNPTCKAKKFGSERQIEKDKRFCPLCK